MQFITILNFNIYYKCLERKMNYSTSSIFFLCGLFYKQNAKGVDFLKCMYE